LLAPATIRNRLRYLTSAARWGWKHHNMTEHDPAARVVMPAVSNEKTVFLTRRQMLQLARACRSWEVRAMIRISFYSGMRLGEIQRARSEDGFWVLDDTKNGEPRRIPAHPRCRPYSAYLWPGKGSVANYVREAVLKAELPPDVTFHTLRHSSATAMLREGVPLYTVGAVLGHKSTASMKRYAHHETQALTDAVRKIGRRA
jgi:integrase